VRGGKPKFAGDIHRVIEVSTIIGRSFNKPYWRSAQWTSGWMPNHSSQLSRLWDLEPQGY